MTCYGENYTHALLGEGATGEISFHHANNIKVVFKNEMWLLWESLILKQYHYNLKYLLITYKGKFKEKKIRYVIATYFEIKFLFLAH